MPTLTWRCGQGEDEYHRVTRPDTDGETFILVVPRSLQSGKPMKLIAVDGVDPAAAKALMEEFG